VISKVLVANRGEIAIRAFRAAYEMGIATVAVYPYEDRNSLHRLKADESYQIGEIGHPVRAYLSVDEIVRVAQQAGADAIYPGYGFLSENPDLAAACAAAGITFVGPSAEILELAGNKSRAIGAARAAGLPVLKSSAPSSSADELMTAAATMEFPLFVKAVSGGGGRGMRRVADVAALPEAIEAASREAESAFGDPTLYLEQAVINPRHIEVQILADRHGNVMHLFERDCSVQRRHQKVIELAPAPNLPEELRAKICADAVTFARRDRGDHRRRSGRQPDAHRRRGVAGSPWAQPGFAATARGCFAMPDHDRGSGQRLPSRHRPNQRLPDTRRRGHPT
jgi:pyruvate carboxylase